MFGIEKLFSKFSSRAFTALGVVVLGAAVSGCGGDIEGSSYRKAERRDAKFTQEIKSKGFAVVGKTPDGRDLLMTRVSYGYGSDRVYFAGKTITAVESCGKSCIKSVTTQEK